MWRTEEQERAYYEERKLPAENLKEWQKGFKFDLGAVFFTIFYDERKDRLGFLIESQDLVENGDWAGMHWQSLITIVKDYILEDLGFDLESEFDSKSGGGDI
jgi:hypothetical protein